MNKSTFSVLVFGIVIIAALSSCTASKHKAEESNFDRIDSLRSYFLTIEDSLLYRWNLMIKDDNERINDLSNLLEELNQIGTVDTNAVNSLREEVSKIKKARYFMTKMTSSQIDFYDSFSFSISSKVIQLTEGLEQNDQYPNLADIISSISAREAKILLYRVNYDNVAKEHNKFVDDHDSILDQIDPEYRHTHLPLFEIPKEDI